MYLWIGCCGGEVRVGGSERREGGVRNGPSVIKGTRAESVRVCRKEGRKEREGSRVEK